MARIRGIQQSADYGSSEFLHNIELCLQQDYHQILLQEEVLWLQKSRLNWVQSGERNTRFFHLTTMVRRHRNLITSLMIGDQWIVDQAMLGQHVTEFFTNLFGWQGCLPLDAPYDKFSLKLTSEENESVISRLDLEEVKIAAFSMKSLKAPGVDGVQPIYYQRNWEVVKHTLFKNTFEGINFLIMIAVGGALRLGGVCLKRRLYSKRNTMADW
ncbi:hypothetical protein COLO4_34521 [Corchorus olitorius]|uniref:Reverse transcriptase n=1 Tax=Corchorus olitorius TaxID=93759 RepID=A0A1R3GKJ7_9ROSI|nr:hypothetical protein COLO4_34521 [Corchorus olitorius]